MASLLEPVREMFRSLTVRGRAFVAAGLTAVASGMVLEESPLVRVGVLVVALPLVTAFVTGRSHYRLGLTRTVTPALTPAGQPARVDLVLSNEGHSPGGTLLLEENVPYVLGTRPRFLLEGVGHGWRRHVSYQVRSDVRGKFQVGPMSVRVTDPFGMVEVGRAFRSTATLVVTPRIQPLPLAPLGGAAHGAGDNRPRAFAIGSAEDVTVREYRQGDDLRRVHWRSSARVGELMVRREEQPWQARATVVIDNRILSHRGSGIASSLETAVSIAASVAVHLNQQGFAVRLVTAAGEDTATAWHFRDAASNTGPLLESLAVLEPLRSTRLETSWLAEASQGGLLFAVFGSLDHLDLPVVRRMRSHAASAAAIALDVTRWGPGELPAGNSAELLAKAGWRVASYAPNDRLDSVWEDLGKVSQSSAAVVR